MQQHENDQLIEIIYSADSYLRRPAQLVRSMVRDFLAARELAWRLFVRNVNAMYRQTILGYIWAFLPPLFTALVFVFLNSQRILNVGETRLPYPAYALIGTVLWQTFTDALNSPLRMINQSKSFIIKINFPREALILAGLAEVFFNFTIRLVLLLLVFCWYRLPISPSILFVPLGVISLVALGLFFGIFLVPLGVLYQDIEKALPLFTSIWLLLTPVVYPPPVSWPASLISIINPVSPLLVNTREMLTNGSCTNMSGFYLVVGLTFLFLLVGWVLYRLALPHLIERLGA
ncbi:MAG: ABC transporter permease [Deltaproteobacteria bacterium]|nr:ABC transporter permease [Deltaproteobacteria bacterium]MBW2071171.1 ABC transporter permease [Deltaproteobacteria bacterium]